MPASKRHLVTGLTAKKKQGGQCSPGGQVQLQEAGPGHLVSDSNPSHLRGPAGQERDMDSSHAHIQRGEDASYHSWFTPHDPLQDIPHPDVHHSQRKRLS